MKTLFLFPLFLLSFMSLATGVYDNPTVEDGDVFHPDYGGAAAVISETLISNPSNPYFNMTCPEATASARQVFMSDRPDSDGVKYSFGATVTLAYNGPTYCHKGIEYTRRTYQEDGQLVSEVDSTGLMIDASMAVTDVYKCPHPDDARKTVIAYVVDTNFCFDPADLNERDSCPDSSSDGAFILPTNGNTASSICKELSDGSLCEYRLSMDGSYYVTDFENSCYVNQAEFIYDDSNLTDPDPEGPECQDMGNGTEACIADKDVVCPNGLCPAGCGFVAIGSGDGNFVCFSGDLDNDGIPDYNDPDKDGDGIPNSEDLDSDGDGVDDPIYGNSSTLETLVSNSNALLEAIKNNTAGGSGTGEGSDIGEDVKEGVEDAMDDITFGTGSGGRLAEAFDALYSQSDIDEVKVKVTEKTDEYKLLISDIQTEAESLFNLNRPSGSFENKTLNISGYNYDISMNRFSSTFSIMGAVVMFLAALGSLAILLGNSK